MQNDRGASQIELGYKGHGNIRAHLPTAPLPRCNGGQFFQREVGTHNQFKLGGGCANPASARCALFAPLIASYVMCNESGETWVVWTIQANLGTPH